MNIEDELDELLDLLSATPGVRPVSYGAGTQHPPSQEPGAWHVVFGVRLQAGREFLQRLSAACESHRQFRCVLTEGDLLRPEPYLTFCLEPTEPLSPALVIQALQRPVV